MVPGPGVSSTLSPEVEAAVDDAAARAAALVGWEWRGASDA
jgi:hypothetical protein